jgi:hypothetical protein
LPGDNDSNDNTHANHQGNDQITQNEFEDGKGRNAARLFGNGMIEHCAQTAFQPAFVEQAQPCAEQHAQRHSQQHDLHQQHPDTPRPVAPAQRQQTADQLNIRFHGAILADLGFDFMPRLP